MDIKTFPALVDSTTIHVWFGAEATASRTETLHAGSAGEVRLDFDNQGYLIAISLHDFKTKLG
jgi:hypothetical protein